MHIEETNSVGSLHGSDSFDSDTADSVTRVTAMVAVHRFFYISAIIQSKVTCVAQTVEYLRSLVIPSCSLDVHNKHRSKINHFPQLYMYCKSKNIGRQIPLWQHKALT